jgi:hypothetical protein
VQSNKAWRNKPDLNALAFEHVTYRQVRDALLRLPALFHSDDFGLLLSLGEVWAAYNRDTGSHDDYRLTVRQARSIAGRVAERPDKTATRRAVRSARALGAKGCASLAKERFIEPDEENGYWVTAVRAGVLMGQKALKPIPRSRAVAHVKKAVEIAKDFNAESGPNYFVTRLYLFGSLLSNKPEVGDVDLFVRMEPRLPTKPWIEHMGREKARMALIAPSRLNSASLAWTEHEGPSRIKKISPYISVSVREELLSELEEEGEAFRLVYGYIGGCTRKPGTEVTGQEVQEAELFLRDLR